MVMDDGSNSIKCIHVDRNFMCELLPLGGETRSVRMFDPVGEYLLHESGRQGRVAVRLTLRASTTQVEDHAGGRADGIQAVVYVVDPSFGQCRGAAQVHDLPFSSNRAGAGGQSAHVTDA